MGICSNWIWELSWRRRGVLVRVARVARLDDLVIGGSGVASRGRFREGDDRRDSTTVGARTRLTRAGPCDSWDESGKPSTSSCDSRKDVACAPKSPLVDSLPGTTTSTRDCNDDTTDLRLSEHSGLSSSRTIAFHVSAALLTVNRCLLLNAAVRRPSTCSN